MTTPAPSRSQSQTFARQVATAILNTLPEEVSTMAADTFVTCAPALAVALVASQSGYSPTAVSGWSAPSVAMGLLTVHLGRSLAESNGPDALLRFFRVLGSAATISGLTTFASIGTGLVTDATLPTLLTANGLQILAMAVRGLRARAQEVVTSPSTADEADLWAILFSGVAPEVTSALVASQSAAHED